MAILIETWLDESVHIMLNKHELSYLLLPKKRSKNPSILTTHPLNYKPPQNHPWRQSQKIMPNPKLSGG
jgi:hypothetical protein